MGSEKFVYVLLVELQKNLVKFKGLEITLFTNRTYTKQQDIHDQESLGKSGFLYSALQSPIQYFVVTALTFVARQRENMCSRLFTEVKPCWTGLISGWVTKSTASDIEISPGDLTVNN